MPDAEPIQQTATETSRVMRTGVVWSAAGMVSSALLVAPLLAVGWRPATLSRGAASAFWSGAVIAEAGLGLLVWAGCPVIETDLQRAHERKTNSIRVGIAAQVAGLAAATIAVLVSRSA